MAERGLFLTNYHRGGAVCRHCGERIRRSTAKSSFWFVVWKETKERDAYCPKSPSWRHSRRALRRRGERS